MTNPNPLKESDILEVACKGTSFYMNGENRCNHCGAWEYTGKHEDNCVVGEIIKRIKGYKELERQRDKLLGLINGKTKAPTAGDALSLVLLGELNKAKAMLSNICSINATAIKDCEE